MMATRPRLMANMLLPCSPSSKMVVPSGCTTVFSAFRNRGNFRESKVTGALPNGPPAHAESSIARSSWNGILGRVHGDRQDRGWLRLLDARRSGVGRLENALN